MSNITRKYHRSNIRRNWRSNIWSTSQLAIWSKWSRS